MRGSRRLAAALVVLVSLALSACGAAPPDSSSSADTAGEDLAQDGAGSGIGEVVGSAPRAVAGFPSVVALEPRQATTFPVPGEVELVDQFATAFFPSVLVVQAGQSIEFRNSEEQMHNVTVFDSAGTMVFNVATPSFDPYTHKFESVGVFDATCGIHPAMAAVIVVVATPYAVVANDAGDFTIRGVPYGTYDVSVWNLGLEQRRESTLLVDAATTELAVDG